MPLTAPRSRGVRRNRTSGPARPPVPASLKRLLAVNGYWSARMLPDGQVAALLKFNFTVGLVVGIDECAYKTRFCYPDAESASAALESWDGVGDPPGPWIKQKGGVDRCNPKLSGIPIVVQARSPAIDQ